MAPKSTLFPPKKPPEFALCVHFFPQSLIPVHHHQILLGRTGFTGILLDKRGGRKIWEDPDPFPTHPGAASPFPLRLSKLWECRFRSKSLFFDPNPCFLIQIPGFFPSGSRRHVAVPARGEGRGRRLRIPGRLRGQGVPALERG